MEPLIKNGGRLLIDLSRKDIYDGKIYCIKIDGGFYAKRQQNISSGRIKIISDSKDYYAPVYCSISSGSCEITGKNIPEQRFCFAKRSISL